MIALLCMLPALALAEVGKVAEVGTATRTGKDGKKEDLKVGTLIQLEDSLKAAYGLDWRGLEARWRAYVQGGFSTP